MIRKLKLLLSIYSYKLRCLLGLKRTDIMSTINEYYREAFRTLRKEDIAVILPHCLIADRCPARFSKQDGVICSKCSLCGCGKVFESAQRRGYQFYITPSVGFTRRLVRRKNIKGVIGIACDYEIEKGIHSEKITALGVRLNGTSVKTQGIRLQAYDCIKNNVDWDRIEEIMNV
ncbi:MAG: DUF116 domain-containing protein [Nitrospiraceae bacterium]|nr:MAG: DUF116 domain-containing protein [Nitrospiraceae bacterium]